MKRESLALSADSKDGMASVVILGEKRVGEKEGWGREGGIEREKTGRG